MVQLMSQALQVCFTASKLLSVPGVTPNPRTSPRPSPGQPSDLKLPRPLDQGQCPNTGGAWVSTLNPIFGAVLERTEPP